MDGNKSVADFFNDEGAVAFLQSCLNKASDAIPEIKEIKENAHAFLNMMRNLSVDQQAELDRRTGTLVPELMAAKLKFKLAIESYKNPEEIARAKATFAGEFQEMMERLFILMAEFLKANNS